MIRRLTGFLSWLPAGFCLLFATTPPTAGAQTCSPTLFIEAAAYPAEGPARLVAIGDFDGDTKPDVATANGNAESISVLLNDGNGILGAPIVTAIPNDAVALAAADLRGNGTTDLVAASYSAIYVLLGHGDGTFDAPVVYPPDIYNISSIVIGQFDANGSWDIALGSYYSGPIAILLGNGNGTFGAPILTDPAAPAVSMTAGDFDSDGHLDLIASNGSAGRVSLYPGAGDGTFGSPTSFIGGADLSGIASGDFDGDGSLDVAVGSGDLVSVLIGDGAGSFQAALEYAAKIRVGILAVGDLDSDGALDIVAAESSDFYGNGGAVSVLRGNGDGSFHSGEAYSAGGSNGLAVSDLNGDSLPDVVTAGGSVFVLLDTIDGSLLAVPHSTLIGPVYPNFAHGDWNGDGRADFAWAANSNQVLVVEAQPDGRFGQTAAIDPGGFNPQPYGVAAGHFFEPGKLDLVVSTYSDVLLFRGNGDGTFQAPVGLFNGSQIGAIEVGDFDGDGNEDVVFNQGCCGFSNAVVLRGNGDGTFQSAVQIPIAGDPSRFVVVDFTASLPPGQDLAVVSSGSVQILVASGDGTFATTATIETQGGVHPSITAGDFDGGQVDLLISDGSANVRLYPGNGDGTFQAPTTVALAISGGSVTAGDYDGDSNTDFAVVSGGRVLVFLGFGDGHFQSPVELNAEALSEFLVTADLLGNGLPHIAAIGQNGIAAFRNSRLGAHARGPASVLIGSAIALEASASGYGPVTYQWRRDGTPLSDGGPISGSQTATLTIDPVSFGDAGSYDIVVTDSCTSVSSNAVDLSVEFADVPASSPFHDDIIAVATAGIAAGCGGGNYCPTSPVRRDQMAVFLLKSEHGSAYTPPACAGVFADVPCPGPFTDWVEQLAAESVTGGCGGGNYCPDASVTRAQMAVFLLKASQGSGYAPPPAVGIFGDVPVGSFAADFIEDLYNRGITGGCQASPPLYCPNNAVLRQQMATFLTRTFFP